MMWHQVMFWVANIQLNRRLRFNRLTADFSGVIREPPHCRGICIDMAAGVGIPDDGCDLMPTSNLMGLRGFWVIRWAKWCCDHCPPVSPKSKPRHYNQRVRFFAYIQLGTGSLNTARRQSLWVKCRAHAIQPLCLRRPIPELIQAQRAAAPRSSIQRRKVCIAFLRSSLEYPLRLTSGYLRHLHR